MDVPGEEPKQHVPAVPEQPVLADGVPAHLIRRRMELVAVQLDQQPASVPEVPGQVGTAEKLPRGVEEVALQVVGPYPGIYQA